MVLTLDYCEKLLNSGKNRDLIQASFRHLFSFEENFEVFSRFCLPKAFSKPFTQFHTDVSIDFLNNENVPLAAPRGHGKSTLVGQGVVIYDIVYQREDYIIYTSENHEKSVSFLEPIHYEMKNNPRLNFIYGPFNVKKGKDELGGREREDCYDIDGIRVQALSFEKNIRGLKFGNKRPTKVILDDIENDQRVLNPLLRVNDMNKLNKQIIPALDPIKGKWKMIGTILHHDSALKNKINLYNGKIYRACEFIPNTTQIDPKTILFPDLYSVAILNKKMRDIGTTSFQSEYMNNPIDDSASIIKREWVISCFDETISFTDEFKFDFKCQGVDFAFSDRITADKSAFVGLGKDAETYTMFSFFVKKGMSITEQFDYIEYLSKSKNFDDNALEENSIRSMSKELVNYDFPYTLFWTGNSDAPIKEQVDPEFKGKRHSVSKINLIKRLGTVFERNFHTRNLEKDYYFRIPYKTDTDKQIAHKILDECTTFALNDGKLVEVGVHGDIPIALAYALERCEMEKIDFAFEMA
jgi:hypothetical protein